MSIPFVRLDDPQYGEVVQVSPLVQRVIAKNPSKFSYLGTGTYLVGDREVAVIDPGPRLDSHREALERALVGRTVTAVLVTHCHGDHSPLAAWLREHTGAPTVAFGPHRFEPGWVHEDDHDLFDGLDDGDDTDAAGVAESAVSEESEETQVEEPHDLDFVPDQRVLDGELAAAGDGWTLRAVHTPGHTSNHLCFELAEEQTLFSGDHVMGWSTTVIAPPDGDMRAYFESLQKVVDRRDAVLRPTHGSPVTDPRPFLAAFMAHRLDREAQVLASVRSGVDRIPVMVRRLYSNVDRRLHRAAARSVLAHLGKLVDDGLVVVDGPRPGLRTRYLPA